MANAKNKFKAAVKKAKSLYKTGRYKRFSDAVKAAYKTIGHVKKEYRQTGTSNSQIDKKRKAKAPGKRVVKHKGSKSTVYYERRKNRTDKPGSLSGAKALIRNSLKERLKTLLYLKETSKLKGLKKQYAKQVRETKADLKKYS
jgi:hypothetical protein